MTKLHEALLEISDKLDVTPKQACWIINNSNLYRRKDGLNIKPNQIYARIGNKNYSNLLKIDERGFIKRVRNT